MSRRGFALLAVLWLVTTLSALVGLTLAATRLGQRVTVNRIHLTRGRWAAEACLAVAHGRWARGRLADTATVDLGRGAWCRWRVEDPAARVNVTTADREVLERLASLAPRDTTVLTTDGPGVVNVSAAPRVVLLALPGITPEAADRILARRALERPIAGLDELAGALTPAAREVLLARYADLERLVVFAPTHLRVTATGGVGSGALRATIELMVVPLPGRLAVVRRRMW